MTKETDKNTVGSFFYLWFGLSVLLNVSGIASIVDGFVHWVSFFRDFLDIYHHLIREPLSWVVHLVLPFWKIPSWVFGLFVIWSAFIFGFNALIIRNEGRSAFSFMLDRWTDFYAILSIFVLGPILIPFLFAIGTDTGKNDARDWLLYTAAVFATVIVLAFLNWQFQRIGS